MNCPPDKLWDSTGTVWYYGWRSQARNVFVYGNSPAVSRLEGPRDVMYTYIPVDLVYELATQVRLWNGKRWSAVEHLVLLHPALRVSEGL